MASLMGTGEAMEEDGTDLAPLTLKTGGTEGADEDGVVSLSSTGAGEIMYTFDTGTGGYDHDGDMLMMIENGGDDCSEFPR